VPKWRESSCHIKVPSLVSEENIRFVVFDEAVSDGEREKIVEGMFTKKEEDEAAKKSHLMT